MSLAMLRVPMLCKAHGKGKSTLYREIVDGFMPPLVHIGPRATALPEHESDAILRARIAGQSDDQIRALVVELVAARALPVSA